MYFLQLHGCNLPYYTWKNPKEKRMNQRAALTSILVVEVSRSDHKPMRFMIFKKRSFKNY